MGAGSSVPALQQARREAREERRLARRERRRLRRKERNAVDPELQVAAPPGALRASVARGDTVEFALEMQTPPAIPSTTRPPPAHTTLLLCRLKRLELCLNGVWYCSFKRAGMKAKLDDGYIALKLGRGRTAPIVRLSTTGGLEVVVSVISRAAVLCDTARIRHNLWRHLAELEPARTGTDADETPPQPCCPHCTTPYVDADIVCPVTDSLHPPQYWQPVGGPPPAAAAAQQQPSPSPSSSSGPASPSPPPPPPPPPPPVPTYPPHARLPAWTDATVLPAGAENLQLLVRSCFARTRPRALHSLQDGVWTNDADTQTDQSEEDDWDSSEALSPTASPGASPTSSPAGAAGRRPKSVVMEPGCLAFLQPLRLEWHTADKTWRSGILSVEMVQPHTERKLRLTACDGRRFTVAVGDETEFRRVVPEVGRLCDAACVRHTLWSGDYHAGWSCPACVFHNTASLHSPGVRESCTMCGTRRPCLPEGVDAAVEMAQQQLQQQQEQNLDKPGRHASTLRLARCHTVKCAQPKPCAITRCKSLQGLDRAASRRSLRLRATGNGGGSGTGSRNVSVSSLSPTTDPRALTSGGFPKATAFEVDDEDDGGGSSGSGSGAGGRCPPMKPFRFSAGNLYDSEDGDSEAEDLASSTLPPLHNVALGVGGGRRVSTGDRSLGSETGSETEWDEDAFTESETDEEGGVGLIRASSAAAAAAAVGGGGAAGAPARSPKGACTVCAKNPKSTVLMPCRHLCACTDCSNTLTKCPVCSAVVTHSLVVWI